jgi:hypothetical protein
MKLATGRGEHDPEHQPADDVADDAPAHVLGRHVGCVRHEHLHGDGAEADRQRTDEERGRRVAECRHDGRGDERHHEQGHERQHEFAVFQQVAERHHEQQAGAIAELREGDEEARGAGRQADGVADRADERLDII